MDAYVTGQTIKMLREKKKFTQAKLAEPLSDFRKRLYSRLLQPTRIV